MSRRALNDIVRKYFKDRKELASLFAKIEEECIAAAREGHTYFSLDTYGMGLTHKDADYIKHKLQITECIVHIYYDINDISTIRIEWGEEL